MSFVCVLDEADVFGVLLGGVCLVAPVLDNCKWEELWLSRDDLLRYNIGDLMELDTQSFNAKLEHFGFEESE